MAALSLTEIQSAFSDDDDLGRRTAVDHVHSLPDHRKRSSPVGPRLVSEMGSGRPLTRKSRRPSRRTAGTVERFRFEPESAGELNKLVVIALWITSGLATHHAITHAISVYLENQRYMSAWNRSCIVFIYPVCVVLLLHYLKTRRR